MTQLNLGLDYAIVHTYVSWKGGDGVSVYAPGSEGKRIGLAVEAVGELYPGEAKFRDPGIAEELTAMWRDVCAGNRPQATHRHTVTTAGMFLERIEDDDIEDAGA